MAEAIINKYGMVFLSGLFTAMDFEGGNIKKYLGFFIMTMADIVNYEEKILTMDKKYE